MKKIFLLLFLPILLCNSTFLLAQEDFVAAGGDASSATGSFSYSIGQVAYDHDASGLDGSINEGVQQPDLDLPIPSYTMNDNTICAGQTVTYTNTSSGATSLNWTFPGGSPLSGTTSPIAVTYTTAGTYTTTLTATNGFGSNTTTQTVTVYALPIVTSNSTYGTICDNVTPVTLSGGSPAGGTYSGTGVSGGQFDPSISGSGTFNITYSYTDGNGCTDTAIGSILVAPCTGVEDNEGANVLLYPNPTSGLLHLTLGTSDLFNSYYEVFDLNGKCLLRQFIWGEYSTISIETYPKATYIVKIYNQQKEVKSFKIIKNN